MRIHVPPSFPPESLVLFVMSTWHVLIALLISRVGVLRRDPVAMAVESGQPVPALSQEAGEVVSF